MRNSTENSYLQTINQVIDYISSHLDSPLQIELLAKQVNVSQRQLLRIASNYLNESLYAYITRQRLERAVMYMQTSDISLTTVSGMVGYDNSQSFSKAFKKQFGISPKNYVNKLLLQLENQVKNDDESHNNLDPEINEEEGMDLVYIRIFGKYGEAESYNAAWNKLIIFLRTNNALTESTRFIGISFDDPNITKLNQCRFYACASVQKKIIPTKEFGVIQIPKGKYAVYSLTGSYSGLQKLYNDISINFQYTLRYGIAFEEYLNSPHNTKEEDLLTKIFIPIK